MNKKGFTLTELISAIVVLAVLVLIAVPTYIVTSRNVKQKNYDSKIEYIKQRAIEYATQNSIEPSAISVSKLVIEGYLAKDSRSNKEYEEIINPLGGYLDCYKIHITLDNNEYEAEVETTDSCSFINTESLSDNISVEVYKKSNINELLGSNYNVNWSGEDVILYVKLLNGLENEVNIEKGVTYQLNGTSHTKDYLEWTNEPNAKYADYNNEHLVTTNLILNATYKVILYLKDNDQQISKEVNVKIDKESPTVTNSIDPTWTNNNTKKAIVFANDGTGSGIYGYYFGTSVLTESEASNKDLYSPNSEPKLEKELPEGNYHVYAMDNVGNTSNVSTINVTNVDTEGSICKYPSRDKEPNENGWYNSNVTITYGCKSDSISGCYTKDMQKTYTKSFRYSEDLNWIIEDTAGNKTTCDSLVELNIDKEPPECSDMIPDRDSINGWYKDDVIYSYGCKEDNLSGCAKNSLKTKTYTVPEGEYKEITETVNWTIKDAASNTQSCSRNITVNIDKFNPRIGVKEYELIRNLEPYELSDNIIAKFGPMGGRVSCSPKNNYGLTGEVIVACVAIGNNGRRSPTATFKVLHQYPATYHTETIKCKNPHNCHAGAAWRDETICDYDCSDGKTRDNVKSYRTNDTDDGWAGAGSGWSETKKVYECPNGGTLRNKICYYE